MRNDRIGDLVLTLPAIMAVRRSFPDARVTLLAAPMPAPLVAGCAEIDEMIVDDVVDSATQLARRLKPCAFDTALVFNTNTRNSLAVWCAGIRTRVLWAYKPAGYLFGNRRVKVHRSHPPIHEAEFALEFVRRLGAKADLATLAPRLEIDSAARSRMSERIRADLGTSGPLFGVHPGNKQSAYNWPCAHYATLVERLAAHGRAMVTGAGEERALLETIRSTLSSKARERVAFYTDLQLHELAAAIAEQTALTVSSTGPMHIAGIVGTPVVALFSPHPAHSPLKWSPLGAGHTLLVAPLEAGEDERFGPERADEVMGRIEVDVVVDANLKLARQFRASASAGQAA